MLIWIWNLTSLVITCGKVKEEKNTPLQSIHLFRLKFHVPPFNGSRSIDTFHSADFFFILFLLGRKLMVLSCSSSFLKHVLAMLSVTFIEPWSLRRCWPGGWGPGVFGAKASLNMYFVVSANTVFTFAEICKLMSNVACSIPDFTCVPSAKVLGHCLCGYLTELTALEFVDFLFRLLLLTHRMEIILQSTWINFKKKKLWVSLRVFMTI